MFNRTDIVDAQLPGVVVSDIVPLPSNGLRADFAIDSDIKALKNAEQYKNYVVLLIPNYSTRNNKNEVVNLNLLNINNIDKVSTDSKVVYVFENPSLLTSLMDLNVPIIITSGIPNISLYTLLKKLEEADTKIYYNGDFDPEGLLIADKLKLRFPKIELFCYNKADYDNAKSKESISDSRLKKLNNISSIELQEIKDILSINKIAAYQEQNINRIRKYITKQFEVY